MDLHHGFSLCDIYACRLVEPAYLGSEHLLWYSSSVKRVYREIEKDVKLEINFSLFREQNEKGQIVDGIKFDTQDLFVYLINHFGLSKKQNQDRLRLIIVEIPQHLTQ
jgi:hypothetical protein